MSPLKISLLQLSIQTPIFQYFPIQPQEPKHSSQLSPASPSQPALTTQHRQLQFYPSRAFKFTVVSSALAPAVQVQNLPERLLGLLPPADDTSDAGGNNGRKRPDIRGVGEAALAVVEGLEARLDLLALIGEAVHRRHAGRHPHSVHVAHLSLYSFLDEMLLICCLLL